MYAINYIQKFVLITAAECQYKFGGAVSPAKWNAAIEVAESRFIKPLLGYDLYMDICNSKNVIVTSGNIASLQASIDAAYQPNGTVVLKVGMIVNANELPTMSAAYQALWINALWSLVYQCVYMIALPKNYAEFSTQGLMKNNPVGSVIADTKTESVGVSLSDVKWMEDRQLLDNINPLQYDLEQYLCLNRGVLPLYNSCKCSDFDIKTKERTNRSTSFLLDIYKDDCCDNCGFEICRCSSNFGPWQ